MSKKNGNKVDQIRDLIFGNQIQDYEDQFKKLSNNIDVLEEKMLRRLNESHGQIQKETQNSLVILHKKIDELNITSQKDKSKLKEQIKATDQNLQAQLDENHNTFVKKIKNVKTEMIDENAKVSEKIALMKDEIQTIIEKKLASLSNEKLSRDSMAEMLVDVAMKMQDKDKPNKLMTKGKSSGK